VELGRTKGFKFFVHGSKVGITTHGARDGILGSRSIRLWRVPRSTSFGPRRLSTLLGCTLCWIEDTVTREWFSSPREVREIVHEHRMGWSVSTCLTLQERWWSLILTLYALDRLVVHPFSSSSCLCNCVYRGSQRMSLAIM